MSLVQGEKRRVRMEGNPIFDFESNTDSLSFHCDVPQSMQRTRRSGDRAQLAPWQVKLATELMLGQTDRPLLLAEVAAPLGVSVNHFIKAFVNTVGTSPYHWFVRQRIARAATLLRETDAPLAEVAMACGFSDQSHLTRLFSRHMGLTPGKWRRTSRAEAER